MDMTFDLWYKWAKENGKIPDYGDSYEQVQEGIEELALLAWDAAMDYQGYIEYGCPQPEWYHE